MSLARRVRRRPARPARPRAARPAARRALAALALAAVALGARRRRRAPARSASPSAARSTTARSRRAGYQAGLWRVDGGWLASTAAPAAARAADTNYHRLAERRRNARFGLPASMPTPASGPLARLALRCRRRERQPRVPAHPLGRRRRPTATTGEGAPGRRRGSLPRRPRPAVPDLVLSGERPRLVHLAGAMFELRAMTLELEERGEPGRVRGALLTPGEHSGVEPLEIACVRRRLRRPPGRGLARRDPGRRARADRRLPRRPPAAVPADAPQHGRRRHPRRRRRTHRLRIVVTDAAGNARTLDPAPSSCATSSGPPRRSGRRYRPATPRRPRRAVAAPRSRGPAVPAEPARRPWPRRNGTPRERAGTDPRLAGAGRGRDRRARRRCSRCPPGVRVRIRGRLTDPRGRADRPRDAGRGAPRADGALEPVTGVARVPTAASPRSAGSVPPRSCGSSTTPTATRRARHRQPRGSGSPSGADAERGGAAPRRPARAARLPPARAAPARPLAPCAAWRCEASERLGMYGGGFDRLAPELGDREVARPARPSQRSRGSTPRVAPSLPYPAAVDVRRRSGCGTRRAPA